MKADITRSTYNKNKKYTKVNAQQGRIQIDADWNEQLDIQEHFNKIMLCDLIGKTGTPFEESGFKIEPKNDGTTDFTIGKGHYYVDGLICENNDNIDASKQEGLPDNPILPPKDGDYVVYLDVWQRHITSLEDPTLLEPALGQTDTTTRTKNVWQAKTLKLKQNPENALTEFEKSIIQSNGKLTARVNSAQNYSGDENRLYRIEIHKSGTIPNVASNSSDGPVFKWSRENAIVAAKILSVKLNGTDLISIVIENRGKGDLYTFRNDQWIEVTDEHCELWNLSGQIFKIKNAKEGSEANQQIIDIEVSNTTSLLHNMAKKDYDYTLNIPKVRLWNIPEDKWNMHSSILSSSQTTPHTSLPLSQTEHNNKVTTSGYEIDTDNYITLEDGIQLKFEPGDYIAGDYWLIPARTITKNIEWPTNPTTNTPEALPSLMKHHYCPLALLKLEPIAGTNNIAVMVAADYRDLFSTVTDSTLSFYSVSGDGQKITPKNVFYAGSSNKVVPLVLRVGVKIGNKPITPELKDKFKVHFKIMPHEDAVAVGSLREPNTNDSGEDTFDASVEGGVASCDWIFLSTKEWTYAEGDKVTRGGQRVSATLMFKPENSSTWIEYLSAPIFFNATFAEPELCYVSGDGQDVRVETLVGVAAPVALEARVVIGGAPYSSIFSKLWRAKINFIVVKGNGKLSGSGNQPISLNDEGFVSCSWTLGDNILPQQVKAELVDLSSSNRVFGSALYFNAKLSQTSAENVLSFYTVSGDGQKITPKNVYIDSSTRGVPLVLCVGAKRGDSLITGDLQKNFFVRFDVIADKANEGVSKLVQVDGALKAYFDADFVNGVASCNWVFCPNELWHKGDGNKVSPNSQVVRATLMMRTGTTKDSVAECLVAPIFFNATFAEPELRYVKGNGAVSNFETDYELSARLFVGEVPLTYSVANLWRVNVQWASSTPDVSLFYNDASNAGGYLLCILSFNGKSHEGLLHVTSEMVNFNKKVFGLAVHFTITFLSTPVSGVIKLDFPPSSNECGSLLAGPIYHEIFSAAPPAIMLSLIPTADSSTPEDPSKPNLGVVNLFEDFCLYNSSANSVENSSLTPRFKVCTVDVEKFWVWVEPPYPSGSCYLRWWAIPASISRSSSGVGSNGYLPVKMGPLINVTNLGGDLIDSVTFGDLFKVVIVNTFTGNEDIKVYLTITENDQQILGTYFTLPSNVSSICEWVLLITLDSSSIRVKAEDGTTLYEFTSLDFKSNSFLSRMSLSISFNATSPLNNLGCVTRVLSLRKISIDDVSHR